ncbi:unnamed protein product [Amaranthus hypochondriacus]
MSIRSIAPNYIKLLQLFRNRNPNFQAFLLHTAIQKTSINEPLQTTLSCSSSNIVQIVDILKSNDHESWKTNKNLSELLFLGTNGLCCDHILKITRLLGDYSSALKFVECLRSVNPNPDVHLLSFAFQAVFELASMEFNWRGKLLELYNTSKELGVPLNVNSAILLIQCFGEGKMIDKAVVLYNELDNGMKNIHVRNVLINGLLRNGFFGAALQVLDEMFQPNVVCPPDLSTVGLVLPALLDGKTHDRRVSEAEILELLSKFGTIGVFPDSIMLTQWITKLCRSRRVDMAWKFLHVMMKLDGPVEVASCNALLTGLAKDKQFNKMKVLMEEMQEKGIKPSIITLGISINHLCKSSRIDEAMILFEKMRRGEIGGAVIEPDVVIYNTLVDGLCKAGRIEEGLSVIRNMVVEGKCSPTNVTYNCLIDGFCKLGELGKSLELFDEMEKQGFEPNLITVNTLVGGMCRHDKAGNALEFYRKMQEKGFKGNKVTYTTLICGFSSVNNIRKTMELFDEMKRICAPDAIGYCALISGLSRAGLMDEVESILLEMRRAGFRPDVVCYNVMINGFCKKNKFDKAYKLMKEMEKIGIEFDSCTYNTLIAYFSKKGDLKTAHRLLRQMIDNDIVPTIYTYASLIHACCLVGELDEAMKIFKQMSSSSRILPDTVIYNILIDSFCQHKKIKVVLNLFEDMIAKGVDPDSSTFNAIFKGLRDENCLEKGLELMEKMVELACQPDYITMEVLTEWLSAVGEVDKLRQFVERYSHRAASNSILEQPSRSTIT